MGFSTDLRLRQRNLTTLQKQDRTSQRRWEESSKYLWKRTETERKNYPYTLGNVSYGGHISNPSIVHGHRLENIHEEMLNVGATLTVN